MKYSIVLILLCHVLLFNCDDAIIKNIDHETGGICLTFDDMYVEEWAKMSELFLENDIKATYFVTMIDKMSQEQIDKIKELDSNGFEIGCHGLKHIDAVKYLENHTLSEYFEEEVKSLLEIMNNNQLYPQAYSYPYGMNNDSLDTFLLNFFSGLRDITDEQRKPLSKEVDEIEEIFCKKGEKQIISSLGIDINFKIDKTKLEKLFNRASNNKEIFVLYAHCPVDSNAHSYQIEYNYIKDLIYLIKEYELSSYTFSEITKI